MKKIFLIGSLFTLACMQACNDNSNKDSVEKADSTNQARDTSGMMAHDQDAGMGVNADVADFAVKAADGGMMEVQLGEYAAKNATAKDVKDFGTMMVTDHTQANGELKAIAAAKQIALPSTVGDDKTKMMNDLMKKTGKDFDKAYMNMMVDDHKEDIKEFEKAAEDSKDNEIKAFAAKALPTLKKHLNNAEAIVKSHNY